MGDTLQQERRLNDGYNALTSATKVVAKSQERNANATAELEREFHKNQVNLAFEV